MPDPGGGDERLRADEVVERGVVGGSFGWVGDDAEGDTDPLRQLGQWVELGANIGRAMAVKPFAGPHERRDRIDDDQANVTETHAGVFERAQVPRQREQLVAVLDNDAFEKLDLARVGARRRAPAPVILKTILGGQDDDVAGARGVR